MLRTLWGPALAGLMLTCAPASANTVSDATGDFLPTFIGPNQADLDVTSFSVKYEFSLSAFRLSAVLAGDIDPTTGGIYVIGANTGTGVIAPFAALGQANVIFNNAIIIRKDGTGNVGANAINPANITISGNMFEALVPLAFLPTTGFKPYQYAFNLWPRLGTGNNNQISDFAPENANIAAVPEPASWAMLIAGFGMLGAMMRQRRTRTILAAC